MEVEMISVFHPSELVSAVRGAQTHGIMSGMLGDRWIATEEFCRAWGRPKFLVAQSSSGEKILSDPQSITMAGLPVEIIPDDGEIPHAILMDLNTPVDKIQMREKIWPME